MRGASPEFEHLVNRKERKPAMSATPADRYESLISEISVHAQLHKQAVPKLIAVSKTFTMKQILLTFIFFIMSPSIFASDTSQNNEEKRRF